MLDQKCPQCGSAIATRLTGGSLVLHCSQCSFEALTTDPNAPIGDRTTYSVRLAVMENPPPRVAASLAVALGISAKTSQALLRRGELIATDVPAVEVQRLHRLLSPHGFALEIEPRFRWALD